MTQCTLAKCTHAQAHGVHTFKDYCASKQITIFNFKIIETVASIDSLLSFLY